MVRGACPELVRTLPGLIFGEHKAEDCDTNGEDDPADALRYGLVSRPAPIPKPNPPTDFDAAAAFKMIEQRQRAKTYIANELMRW